MKQSVVAYGKLSPDGKTITFDKPISDAFVEIKEGEISNYRFFCEIYINTGKRSEEQNRFYWGLLSSLCNALNSVSVEGWTKEKLHLLHTTRIFGLSVKFSKDKKHMFFDRLRTSQMSKEDFRTFINAIIAFWAEKGFVINASEEDYPFGGCKVETE